MNIHKQEVLHILKHSKQLYVCCLHIEICALFYCNFANRKKAEFILNT